MKVVLNTNVLISALISPHNPPDLILQSWLAGDFELLTSHLYKLSINKSRHKQPSRRLRDWRRLELKE